MPPSYRFTRDEIIGKAFEITRKHGMRKLTARYLASCMDSSPKIIFGSFSGMEELRECVMKKAQDFFSDLMMKALSDRTMMPYLSCGLCYVEFAHDEKHLFDMLYMRDRSTLPPSVRDNTLEPIYLCIMHGLGVTHDIAVEMHWKYSIFAHGLACGTPLPTEDARRLLEENWQDLVRRYAGK